VTICFYIFLIEKKQEEGGRKGRGGKEERRRGGKEGERDERMLCVYIYIYCFK